MNLGMSEQFVKGVLKQLNISSLQLKKEYGLNMHDLVAYVAGYRSPKHIRATDDNKKLRSLLRQRLIDYVTNRHKRIKSYDSIDRNLLIKIIDKLIELNRQVNSLQKRYSPLLIPQQVNQFETYQNDLKGVGKQLEDYISSQNKKDEEEKMNKQQAKQYLEQLAIKTFDIQNKKLLRKLARKIKDADPDEIGKSGLPKDIEKLFNKEELKDMIEMENSTNDESFEDDEAVNDELPDDLDTGDLETDGTGKPNNAKLINEE